MHDPFPLAAPPLLISLTTPLANYLSLPTLPLHIHEVLFATLAYHCICHYLSPYVSTRLFPTVYPKLSRKTRLNWDVHVVSLAQSCFINTLALWVMFVDEERSAMDWEERVWGYTGADGMIQGFAAGYFLWDLFVCVGNVGVFGFGLLAHAIAALVVFSLGFVSYFFYLAVWLGSDDVNEKGLILRVAAFCQFLWPNVHPLRAIFAFSQFPLVLR